MKNQKNQRNQFLRLEIVDCKNKDVQPVKGWVDIALKEKEKENSRILIKAFDILLREFKENEGDMPRYRLRSTWQEK